MARTCFCLCVAVCYEFGVCCLAVFLCGYFLSAEFFFFEFNNRCTDGENGPWCFGCSFAKCWSQPGGISRKLWTKIRRPLPLPGGTGLSARCLFFGAFVGFHGPRHLAFT